MSMFRRPTDDSSDSSSSSEESEVEELDESQASAEEVVGVDLAPTNTLSSGESISIDHSQDEAAVADVEHVRNMMLASLLEDFYKTRAAELVNTANPGSTFHRHSPEIQPLARNLFDQASQALLTNGLLPSNVVSRESQAMRGQYLSGFDNFGLQNIRDADLLPDSMKRQISASDSKLALVKSNAQTKSYNDATSSRLVREVALRTDRLSIVPHPMNDTRLSSAPAPRSHYQASFQELRLLGRGGFGRVYQTYNVFDKKEYAVKKIPLSAKMSRQYREKGHAELASILKEVQALAQLDHHNVVRYHATWIEEPTAPTSSAILPELTHPLRQQRLIADRPTFVPGLNERRRSSTKLISYGASDGIRFEADSAENIVGADTDLGWSHKSHSRQIESSMPDTDIFTDGVTHNNRSDKVIDDPSCYVLHVQMSMYPRTLAQYISVTPHRAPSGPFTSSRRHCFHLIPALRILLGIICGLQYVHAQGLIHRDIKPSNIFLSNYDLGGYTDLPDGYHDVGSCPSCPIQNPYHVNPRIGDFGLVADLIRESDVVENPRSSSYKAVGTEYYRPPMSHGKEVQHKTDEKLDVYALGVILIEMLWRCGTSMERIDLLKDIQREKLPRDLVSTIDAEGYPVGTGKLVEECVKGMITKNHLKRWTCAEVKQRVEDVLSGCNARTVRKWIDGGARLRSRSSNG